MRRPSSVLSLFLVASLALAGTLNVLAAPASARVPVPAERGVRRVRTYLAPVAGPIVDHFRPPACPWCAGNRGIDYAVAAGTPVRASAAGVVSFAGPVGNDRFVVVAHPDGLRTTYGFLATVGVTAGQPVAQGQVVGTAGDRLHFGVRRGEVYLDPESILAGTVERVRLVPVDGSAPRRRLG